jgi:hypothetical protein
VAIGTLFPALPGVTEGFNVLAIEPECLLMLGWPAPDGTPEVTWTFFLEETASSRNKAKRRLPSGNSLPIKRGCSPSTSPSIAAWLPTSIA